jgi:hypothetical protein
VKVQLPDRCRVCYAYKCSDDRDWTMPNKFKIPQGRTPLWLQPATGLWSPIDATEKKGRNYGHSR